MATTIDHTPEKSPQLRGNMGALPLFFSVMAWNAPLVIVMGIIPIMVGVGAGLGTPVSFLVAGGIIALFAAGFCRMARVVPRPGAFYAYITAGLGRVVGLGAGLLALLGYFCGYAGTYTFGGVMLSSLIANTFAGPVVPWWVCALAFWVFAGILGYLKLELSAKVLTCFLFAEVLIVVVYNALVVGDGGAHGITLEPLAASHWFDGSFAIGLLFGLGMFGGFEITALFREEVRDPDRTIPRAAFGVIIFAASFYALTSLIFINALGVDRAADVTAADPAGAMTDTILLYGGNVLSDLMNVLVVTSTCAVILAGHNMTSRYIFNLSADGILPKSLSQVHVRHGSPHMASLAATAAALVLNIGAVAYGVDALLFYAAALGITSLVLIIEMLLTSVAVPAYLKRERPDLLTPVVGIIFPTVASIGLGIGVYLAVTKFDVLVGGSSALRAMLMVIIATVFCGGMAMALLYKRTRPATYAKIGRQ